MHSFDQQGLIRYVWYSNVNSSPGPDLEGFERGGPEVIKF